MARAERHNADYFPFLCKEGNNTKYIEQTYGNDGFAVWVKVLRQLTVNNYHYIDLSIKPKLMTFASVCRVSEDLLITIMDDLAELEEIDKHLWRDNRIVWSDKFIENIQDAYKNRKNQIIKKEAFIRVYEGLTGKKLKVTDISYAGNTHTIEEKTIGEKSKEENTSAGDEAIVPRATNEEQKGPKPLSEDTFEPLTEQWFASIFDEIHLQDKQMTYREHDVIDQLLKFKSKVRGSPADYIYRDTDGMRKAFDYQLRTTKPQKKYASNSRTLTETSPTPGKDYSEKF